MITFESITPEWISALSTLILVLATCTYVYYTIKLAKETKKLREVETTPFISLQIGIFRNTTRLQLTIKNIGKAPAYNIKFEIEEKYKEIFRFNFDNKIAYFAPDQKVECFGKDCQDFKNLDTENIPIKVIYYSKEDKKCIEKFSLEWSHLDGVLLERRPYEKIEKSLDTISKNIELFVKNSKNKQLHITNRIKIIEINKSNFYFTCLFNDGYLGKIEFKNINHLKISDLKNIELINGDLYDYTARLSFSAEEIYNKFKNIKKVTYK